MSASKRDAVRELRIDIIQKQTIITALEYVLTTDMDEKTRKSLELNLQEVKAQLVELETVRKGLMK